MALEQEMACFEEQRETLAADHHGKYALVYGQEVHGFFDTPLDAYEDAIRNKIPPGSFLIQKCVLKEEEEISVFYTTRAG